VNLEFTLFHQNVFFTIIWTDKTNEICFVLFVIDVYQLKGIMSTTIVIFFIPNSIVVFRVDLHKMKIKHQIIGEYATKRCFSI